MISKKWLPIMLTRLTEAIFYRLCALSVLAECQNFNSHVKLL